MNQVEHSMRTSIRKEKQIRIDIANLASFLRETGVGLPDFFSVELEKEIRNTLIFTWGEEKVVPGLDRE